ncbi:MAG: hypothetical protein K6G84_11560 [Lachnospiraceae bacterium]|nr:hypothetical protein [Lachnospiraceae bacterium]
MKRIILAAVLCTACLTLGACSGKKGNDAKESTAATETTEAVTEESVEPAKISQDDADQLISEKLDGTNANAIYNNMDYADGMDIYTYTVVDADGNELDQMLAVDSVSGEVYVYDYDNEVLSDFSEFELYDPDSHANISWSGTFTLDKMTVTLDPADDNSFEFSFANDGETEFQGVAQIDGNKASYEDDDVKLTFEFDKDGSLKVVNNGNINSYAGIYAKGD